MCDLGQLGNGVNSNQDSELLSIVDCFSKQDKSRGRLRAAHLPRWETCGLS